MAEENDLRRDEHVQVKSTRTNTIIAALATILAAVILAAGGIIANKNQTENELENDVRQLRKQLTLKNDESEALNRTIAELREQLARVPGPKPAPISSGDIYATGNLVSTVEVEGFEIRLYGCRRQSGAVRCYYAVTNTRAERSLQMLGYPGDERYSRAYDDHGRMHTVNVPEISGVTGNEITIPEGVALRASIVFQTVPASIERFSVLKFVFQHAHNGYAADFRNVPVT